MWLKWENLLRNEMNWGEKLNRITYKRIQLKDETILMLYGMHWVYAMWSREKKHANGEDEQKEKEIQNRISCFILTATRINQQLFDLYI